MSSAEQTPDAATITLIRRQRELLALMASQDRADLIEYVDADVVVQQADTSVSPNIVTYTLFNMVNDDIDLSHGGSAEYRAEISGRLGVVTTLMRDRCVVTTWRRDTAGWRATRMQILPAAAARIEPADDSENPLLCRPSDNLGAALLRAASEP